MCAIIKKTMKQSFLLLCVLTITVNCFSQQSNFKSPCSKIGLDSLWADTNEISCYLIPVSKNISKTANGKFLLAVAVAPSLKKSNEEPLLYLHGGPGIATLGNVPRYLESKTWKLIREKRSIIFFDYRGTGVSEPNLCAGMEDSLNAFVKTKPTDEAKHVYTTSLYKNCRERMMLEGTDISSFSAMQLAADAEEIRRQLQISKWNVYGVSYGTTVALNMLRNHSKHIKGVILDSPFPPNAPWVDFVNPFASTFKVLEKNIASDPIIFSRFPNIRNDFAKAVERLNKNSLKSGDSFAWSIWKAMLNPKAIPLVPLAIHEVANGNDSILLRWYLTFNLPNSFGKFSEAQSKAIECYEQRPRTEEESQKSLLLKYPEFSSFSSVFDEAICNAWRPDLADKKIFKPVVSNKPVLILAGEYDPVCPPLFGEITAKTLSKATFVVVPSASHAAIHADDCVRNFADTFLLNPSKKPDTKCVNDRLKINFAADNLSKALSDFKN